MFSLGTMNNADAANYDRFLSVTMNLLQGPASKPVDLAAARWMLKQVQHDDY